MELVGLPSSSNPPLENFPLFEHLPAELALKIFSYLGPKELLLASRVCLLFNQYYRDESFWKVHLQRERPFEKLKGKTHLQAYGAAGQSRINVSQSRYTVEEITLKREHASPDWRNASYWGNFRIYNGRLYATTNQKTVEIWDLHTREKAGNDISLQSDHWYDIYINSQIVWLVSTAGMESFNHLTNEQTDFQPHSGPFFLTDAVRVTCSDGQIQLVGDEERSIESNGWTWIQNLFVCENILYALTDGGFLERWELSGLTQLEKVDVRINTDPANEGEKITTFYAQIIGVDKTGKVVIEYEGDLQYKRQKMVISWDLKEKTKVKEIDATKVKKFIEAGGLLFCIGLEDFVEVRDFATLELKSRFNFSPSLNNPESVFSMNCCWDGYKVYVPKKWDFYTTTLEVFDFLPEDEALQSKGQIVLRAGIEKATGRAARNREIWNHLDDNNCGDHCLGTLSVVALWCVDMATDLFEYFWDMFCDLTEWVSSFFDEGEEEEPVQDIGPPFLIPLPNDRPADNNGNNI